MTKVNEQNYGQLDFLINNFYEIVEYKRGRGIYGDRVILKRPKKASAIIGEPDKLYEFYYMDANAVKEMPRTIQEKIKVITRFVTSPEDMNILSSFSSYTGEPSSWAIETRHALIKAKTLDYGKLNDVLMERYKKLDGNFLNLLKKHREKQYFLASSPEFNFVSRSYAEEQISRL